MADRELVILKGAQRSEISSGSARVITFDDLKEWVRRGAFAKEALRYSRAHLITQRTDALAKPLLTAILLRLLSRGDCRIVDERGVQESVTASSLLRRIKQAIGDWRCRPALLQRVDAEIQHLQTESGQAAGRPCAVDLTLSPVYLRTDLWYGIRSGGSVGHIAGVLNHLDHFAAKPVFLTTDRIPTVREDIETHLIPPPGEFWDFAALPSLALNAQMESFAREALRGRRFGFVYQRYGTNNFAGLKLARSAGVPFVLEYNGSEIWINRNWGTPLRYEALSERIELLNLRSADLVVVVSEPMRAELLARGVDNGAILVNPNGVDAQRYHPQVDGSAVRERYGFGNRTVLGFIGTFGKWHGAEILAEAFGRLLVRFPGYRERMQLLMIGDGLTMPEVRRVIAAYGLEDVCTFAGMVPQADGPEHLAACDILVSPHVPNVDGTPFFGSPTKLFEYMAMGKGIVASDLDQIGEVLEHGRTAWMVEPGNPESLMPGLKQLIDDPTLRERLGRAAGEEAVAHHTWEEHTHRIVRALRERCH